LGTRRRAAGCLHRWDVLRLTPSSLGEGDDWLDEAAGEMINTTDGSMLSFITADIDKYYLDSLKKYYAASGDKVSKIVDFSSKLPSPFLRGNEIIGGKDNFSIIDSFGGIKPIVLNHRYLVEGDGGVHFQVGVALDSQVVTYLHQYVTNDRAVYRSTPRGAAIRMLLKRISSPSMRGWDFNPFFYLMESVSKGIFEQVFPHAAAFSASILRLQAMDSEHFLQTGEIVPDPEKIEEHALCNKAAPFVDTAGNMVVKIASIQRLKQEHLIQAIYATLLKICLLHQTKATIERKLQELIYFFQNDLGVYLMREALLSCLHFAGKSGTFLPLQTGAKNVRKKLLASSWDLYLLRVPEFLIGSEGNEYTSIYYVCTAEKTLQRLGRLFVVRRIATFKEERVPPSIGYRVDLLEQEIGAELTARFFEMYQKGMADSPSRTPKNLGEVKSLVDELEREASQIAEL
jgi:hypothetical protein